jgi:hypothetical protein
MSDTYCICYADSARGIYIPQHFAESCNRAIFDFSGCYPDSLDILLSGPDHGSYWDAWQDILDHAETTCGGVLYQDGDLWIIWPDRARDAINSLCASQLEYEESDSDAGNNYAFLVSKSWCATKEKELLDQLTGPTVTIDLRTYEYGPLWQIDPMGLTPEELSEIALDIFTMEQGSIYGPYETGIILDSFPIQEIEIGLDSLGIPDMVLDFVRDSCEPYINSSGDAYLATDAVWYAMVNPAELQNAIKEYANVK